MSYVDHEPNGGRPLLVVSARSELGDTLQDAFRAAGQETLVEADAGAASAALDPEKVEAVLVDLALPGLSMENLKRAIAPEVQIQPVPLDEVERKHIQETLRYTRGNRRAAANLLGIARSTLLAKIRRYQLDRQSRDSEHETPSE
jgi:DNA-binding NtrC family response regulator